jgi:triacylglycerol lipase
MVNIVTTGTIPRLKNPIALVHGLFGFDRVEFAGLTVANYFPGVAECLIAGGNRLLIPRLHPIGGVAHRAQELKEFLLRESPHEPIHIIAHSMGGLDSRYMISMLGMADHVLSLTTLGTPHRGSPFADRVLALMTQGTPQRGFANWVVGKLAQVVRPTLRALNLFGVPNAAIEDLTTARCSVFNAEVPNCSKVRYFSVAGRLDYSDLLISPEWALSHNILSSTEGDNDGIVSVASAQFGDGFEIWEGDHFSLVNWFHPVATNRYNRDPAPRFGPLIGRLADLGF